MRYRTHGWILESQLPLPGLALAEVDDVSPHLHITLADLPADLEGGRQCAPWLQATPEAVQLEVASVGRLRVSRREGGGVEVVAMATTPGADLASWVLGPALAAALYLEGLFPLHASACVVDGKAWGFSGPSQAGKSTLLRGLVDRGAGMLTDDFLVFDPATGLAQPGRPSVRLWQDALARLEDEAQRGAAPLSADLPKFVVPTEDAFHPSPAPLAGVVFLSPVYADHLELEDLPGRVGLAALLQNAHFPYLLDALERRGPHLGYATRAASALQLLEARRPRTVQRLDALVEAVLERISDQA